MAPLARLTVTTPIGPMLALSSPQGLCALEFVDRGRLSRLDARLRRWFPGHSFEDASSPFIDEARAWLDVYFAGADPGTPRLDLRGTAFELQIWRLLLAIPSGARRTYGELARTVGTINAARAVGLAVGSNPVGIIVPCHRVVGSSGSLTGYGGGLDKKRWLLDHEARERGGQPLLEFDSRRPAALHAAAASGDMH